MAPTETDLKSKADQAVESAKEFTDIYYEHLDKKRNALKNLYLDSANLLWNGHAVSGKDNIIKYLEDLPPSSVTLSSRDCQPVDASAFENQTTIVVTTFGKVKFSDNEAKGFYQTFLLSSKDNVWKIVSDNYRFLEKTPANAGLY